MVNISIDESGRTEIMVKGDIDQITDEFIHIIHRMRRMEQGWDNLLDFDVKANQELRKVWSTSREF